MFYYFGRKARLAKLYPKPYDGLVIEPFAGSMAYTLHHRPTVAIGIEADPTVCKAWRGITAMSAEEILEYPKPTVGVRVRDRWSMMAAGSHGTTKALSYLWTERMDRDFVKQRRMAAKAVDYAKTIKYIWADYRTAPDVEATWFIDPPYQAVKRGYHSNIDYDALAKWCRSRKGLVIVCEQAGATWLPFKPLVSIKGTNNKVSTEAVWIQRS